jgi:hypothetical protein
MQGTSMRNNRDWPKDELAEQMAGLRGDVHVLRSESSGVRHETSALRSDMNSLRTDVNSMHRHLDDKMTRQFNWIVGLQVAALLAIISGLLRFSFHS